MTIDFVTCCWVIGLLFFISFLFLTFLYIRYLIEERFNIKKGDSGKRLVPVLVELDSLCKDEFPDVSTTCYYLLDILNSNSSLSPNEIYQKLNEKYGDDRK